MSFETEEDSFDPKSETSIALSTVNQDFGRESRIVQIIAVAEDGNVLSQEALMDMLVFQWSLENQSVITSTLATNQGSTILGPVDIIFGIHSLLEGVDVIEATLEYTNQSVDTTPFLALDSLGESIQHQLDALDYITNSDASDELKSGALDIFSLMPTLLPLIMEMDDSGEEGSMPVSFPVDDLYTIVGSSASPAVKGNATDILLTQMELAGLLQTIENGDFSGEDPLSPLATVLKDDSFSRQEKTLFINATLNAFDTYRQGMASPMETLGYAIYLAGEVLDYIEAVDMDNATLFNSTLYKSASENSTYYIEEAEAWYNLEDSISNLIGRLSTGTATHGDINRVIEDTEQSLLFSKRIPLLNSSLTEYNETLDELRDGVLFGDIPSIRRLAMESSLIQPQVKSAAGASLTAANVFMQITNASQNLSDISDTLQISMSALEEWGFQSFFTSYMRRLVQDIYDIYSSDASGPVIRAATNIFTPPEEGMGDGSPELASLLEPFFMAMKAYRDIQWNGEWIESYGDTLLLSQFHIMQTLESMPQDTGDDMFSGTMPNNAAGPGRKEQLQWISNSTGQDILYRLKEAREYNNEPLMELGQRTSETLFKASLTAFNATERLSNASDLIRIAESEYSWRNNSAILWFSGFVGDMAGQMVVASQSLDGAGIIMARLPETGEAIRPTLNQLSLFLSADFSLEEGEAKSCLIMVFQDPEVSTEERKEAQQMIKDMAEGFHGGTVVLRPLALLVFFDTINDTAQRSLFTLFPLALLFIFVVLLINYRGIGDAILSLLALVMSIIWIFGIAVLLGYKFNVIAVAVPVLLVGLGIDYAIHLIMRYREEKEKGEDITNAASKSILTVGGAITLTTITTMIGFLSNTTSSIAPIRDFGLLTALGILCALIVMITFVPSMKIFLDERKNSKEKTKKKKNSNKNNNRRAVGTALKVKGGSAVASILGSSAYAAEKHPFKLMAIVVAVTLVCAYGATQLQTEFDIMDFLPDDIEESRTIEYLIDNFNFTDNYVYIYIEGDMTSPEVLSVMDNVSHAAMDIEGVIAEPSSAASIIRQMGRKTSADADYNQTISTAITQNDTSGDGIPDRNLREVYDTIRDNEDEWTRLSFVLHYNEKTSKYDSAVVRIGVDLDGIEVLYMADELTETAQPLQSLQDVEYVKVTGGSIVGEETMNEINRNQIRSLFLSLALSLLVLTLIMWKLDKSPALGAITVIPIGIVIVWMWGSMYFFGFKLNVMTNMIAAISVGLGLTYAIHITHRFKEELDKHGDPDIACRESVSRTGLAVTGAAVTTMGGFFILGFSVIKPLKVFGQITGLAVLYGYIASVFILPTMLVMWAKHRKNSEEKNDDEKEDDKSEGIHEAKEESAE